jgi:Na+/melibiose symporter-like transporter
MPLGRKLAFVSPAFPAGALALPLAIYLPAFYGGYVGLSLAVVGQCFFLVRSLDIGFDPFMGWVLDRTRTPWGQCRPWMAAGAAVAIAAILLLFLAEPGATPVRLVIGLLMLYAATSILGVAQPAWAARLAPDYQARSAIYAWVQVGGSAGTVVLLGVPMLLGALGHAKPGADVHGMGVALAVAMPLTVALALWLTPEPAVPAAHHGQRQVRFADYLRLLRRPNIARLVIADLFVSLGTAASSALFLFFWHAARGYSGPQTNLVIIVYYVAAVISVPGWVRLVAAIGKRAAFLISGMGFVLIMPTMALIPRGRVEILAPALAVVGLTFSAGTFLIRAMAADASDEARLDTGVDQLGQIYGLLSSTVKMGSAIAVGVTYAILDKAGFKPALGVANTPGAVHVLAISYIFGPALMNLIGLLPILGYRLSQADHARLRAELDRRDALAAMET